ncbi:helix-turn-helix transcriptional regulator [Streptomyces sp. NPDC007205]|uniref:helix-turn-helix domain-containing protein n=1 Tax=Streptomyces sp. NPDC007205 TaxID=3154316 RepID=UPI0033F502AC
MAGQQYLPGRPQRPIAPDSPSALRELALRLREMRAASGLTLQQLADRIPTNPSTLSRVSSGRSLASWQVVSAFADACQADATALAELRVLWEEARTETRAAKNPAALDDTAGLKEHFRAVNRSATLRELYEAVGRPTLRELADKSGRPRSTVHRTITGRSATGAADIAEALLSYIPPRSRGTWEDRVNAVFGSPPSTPAPVEALFKVAQGDAAQRAERVVAEFMRALRQLRNLAVHGEVELSPQLAVQVLKLQMTIEAAAATGRAVVDTSASAWPELPGTGGQSAPPEEDDLWYVMTEDSDEGDVRRQDTSGSSPATNAGEAS